jgi:hypothetical protein
MLKLELLPQFAKRYGSRLHPDLESFKYCQDSKVALVEMTFKGGNTVSVNLDFIVEGEEDNDGDYTSKPSFDPSDDMVDNARKLVEMEPYSLVNCFNDLFSPEAELVISDEFFDKGN